MSKESMLLTAGVCLNPCDKSPNAKIGRCTVTALGWLNLEMGVGEKEGGGEGGGGDFFMNLYLIFALS